MRPEQARRVAAPRGHPFPHLRSPPHQSGSSPSTPICTQAPGHLLGRLAFVHRARGRAAVARGRPARRGTLENGLQRGSGLARHGERIYPGAEPRGQTSCTNLADTSKQPGKRPFRGGSGSPAAWQRAPAHDHPCPAHRAPPSCRRCAEGCSFSFLPAPFLEAEKVTHGLWEGDPVRT